MSKVANGECLCGSVKLSFKLESESFGACHCGMCRKWNGGPAMAIGAGANVQISGEEFISAYKSSPWGERGFCKTCGTHLFFRLIPTGSYIIPVGLLDIGGELKFASQIFIDKKPANYSFAEHTENMTEAEFLSKFGG